MQNFLEEFYNFAKENNINVYRCAAVKGDGEPEAIKINGGNPCQNSYSAAKAFVVTAIGLLYDEGVLKTDEYICDILAEYCPENMSPLWRKITVDMALRHHLGLPGGFLDIDTHDANTFGFDYLGHALSYPIKEPDEFVYTDAAFYILGRVAAAKAGKPLMAYLWEKLFFPLECREVAWSCCPQGYIMGATGLYIRTIDMVKLGAVYLNNGTYKGKRILSEEWVKTVIDNGYELKSCGGGKAYGKGGMRGQKMMVVPAQNRVVAWLGCGDNGFTDFCANYED
jgi:CubicO group peptidase (beta-lactamase class C family)